MPDIGLLPIPVASAIKDWRRPRKKKDDPLAEPMSATRFSLIKVRAAGHTLRDVALFGELFGHDQFLGALGSAGHWTTFAAWGGIGTIAIGKQAWKKHRDHVHDNYVHGRY
jgi:hypothetical protein